MSSLPSPVSGRHTTQAGAVLTASDPTSARLTQENITLLQSLVQPTRYHRRVQPQFEVLSVTDPGYVKYNLKRYLPRDPESGAVTSDRAASHHSGLDRRCSAPLEVVGSSHHPGGYGVYGNRPPHCQGGHTARPSVMSDAVSRASRSGYRSPPARRAEGAWPTTLSGQPGAGEGVAYSDRGVGGACDCGDCSDCRPYSERPPSARIKGRLYEDSFLSPCEVESSGRGPSEYWGAHRERGEGSPGERRPVAHVSQTSAYNPHVISSDGATRRQSGHGGHTDDVDNWVDMANGAYRDHDSYSVADELSYHQPPPSASRRQRHGQPRGVSSSAGAPAPQTRPLLQSPTRRGQRETVDVGSQWTGPFEGGTKELPRLERKKKAGSNRRNSRAFQNWTTHTWVTTNTTTSVILPSATVHLIPMSTVVTGDKGSSVNGRWTAAPAAAVLPPSSPYALPSSSVPDYQQHPSRMEVLDDSSDATANARSRAGHFSFRTYQAESRDASGGYGVYHSRPEP